MSAGPDAIVERAGELVTLERVVDYAIDANGQVVDKETETVDIPAVVSQPSEQDEQRLEGRLETGAIKLTVPSTEDIRADRNGQRDRIYRQSLSGWGDGGWGDGGWGGSEAQTRLYQVVEVIDDTHALTGTRKKSVMLNELSSHE